MDAELKAKWLAALRSGDYEQGRGRLRNAGGGFCCLGVLCEVAQLKHTNVGYENPRFPEYSLTLGVDEAFGIDLADGEWALQRMNDTAKKSFPEIADWIEANL